MATFALSGNLCEAHKCPENYYSSVSTAQARNQAICSKCMNSSACINPSGMKASEDFLCYFQDQVKGEVEKMSNSSLINVASLFDEKREEIERRQLKVLEAVVGMLRSEKESLFEMMGAMERAVGGDEKVFVDNVERRRHLLRYLGELSRHSEILEIKVVTSTK